MKWNILHLSLYFRTVYGFKHFLGRKIDDPKVQEAISNAPYKVFA
jgi:hypothetical protein